MKIKLKEELAPLFKKGDVLDVTNIIIDSYKVGTVTISKDLVSEIESHCEWIYTKDSFRAGCCNNEIMQSFRDFNFTYCPYCGKQILEVIR
jgi:hypothetical protein